MWGGRSVRITARIRCKTDVGKPPWGAGCWEPGCKGGDGNDSASESVFPPFSPPSVAEEGDEAAGERGGYKCSGAGMYTLFLTPWSVMRSFP